MSAASLSFVSWVRRGASTAIETRDGEGVSTRRVKIPITVQFNDALDAEVRLGLFGPGEVVSFDTRAVIRRWPDPGVTAAEPNMFPLVEFDQADLPWRYTPARANLKGRVRPWLCLIALASDEIIDFVPRTRERAFDAVTIRAGTPLPPPDQLWAWAHVQLSGTLSANTVAVAEAVEHQPQRIISRLLCPRQLEPGKTYQAMLVPVFELSRRAGLGLPIAETDDALAPAWAADGAPLTLPIYDRWRFMTGPDGDFEDLVRRLRPRRLSPTIGARALDVSQPGAGLPPALSTPLGLEGALKLPTAQSTVWTGTERDRFIERLSALLNLPADVREAGGPPVVAPPLYGCWPSLQERLRPGQPPVWFQLLNEDPRHRVAAGLGTLVIQSQERPLLASAWAQVGEIREINDWLRHAQLAREMSVRMHERIFTGVTPERALSTTSLVHARVAASPTTVRAVLNGAPIPTGLLSGTLRRISRPLGPTVRRQAPAEGSPAPLLVRANSGELRAEPPPVTPEAVPTFERLRDSIVPGDADEQGVARLRRLARALGWAGGIVGALALLLALFGLFVVAIVLAAAAVAATAAAWVARRRAENLERRLAFIAERVSPDMILGAAPRPDFVATDPVLATPAAPPVGAAGEDSPSARAFRAAAVALARQRAIAPAPGAVLRPADLDGLRQTLSAALNPHVTIAEGMRARLRLRADLIWVRPDPLEPVITGPEFPQAMYKPLAELSPEWILPGLGEVPPDTVALLVTNQPFIEAYMVGLNHEMARELLWNEYPASQRATYFRQFWESTGLSAAKDIRRIHQWPNTATLGDNGARPTPPSGQHLVVLIRGEVFRRYPHTTVYAVKARREQGVRVLGEEELAPVLRGSLLSDAFFFGFELTAQEARGDDGGEGWFFVLQEQASEPKFGLDAATQAAANPALDWDDLSWGHLVPPGGDPREITYINLDNDFPRTSAATLNDARWHADRGLGPAGARSADLAYITLQQPVRVALHGVDMLPPEGGL